MAKVLRYKNGDRFHDLNEGSAAQKLAAADGQFELVGEVLEDGTIAVAVEAEALGGDGTAAEDEVVDLSKLTKAQLIIKATELGIEGVVDTMNKAQIVEAIEAKLAETPADDANEDSDAE